MRGGGVSVTTTSDGVLASSISGGRSLTAAHHRPPCRRPEPVFGSRLPDRAARTFRGRVSDTCGASTCCPISDSSNAGRASRSCPPRCAPGSPFAHACGGNGKCSTCRIVVVEGHQSCSERTLREQAIADRLGFGPQFRLACQTSVRGEVTVRRLVLDERDVELADLRRRPPRGHRRRQFRAHFARRRVAPTAAVDRRRDARDDHVRRHPRLHRVRRDRAPLRRDPRPAAASSATSPPRSSATAAPSRATWATA